MNYLVCYHKIKEKNIPFVGDKKAIFVDDDCAITLDSPHLNFDMELMYITNEFYNKYVDKLQKKEQLEKEKKKNLL